MLLYTGGEVYGRRGNYVATILKFDATSLSWSEVGEMAKARYYHAASVVRVEEVEQFCV